MGIDSSRILEGVAHRRTQREVRSLNGIHHGYSCPYGGAWNASQHGWNKLFVRSQKIEVYWSGINIKTRFFVLLLHYRLNCSLLSIQRKAPRPSADHRGYPTGESNWHVAGCVHGWNCAATSSCEMHLLPQIDQCQETHRGIVVALLCWHLDFAYLFASSCLMMFRQCYVVRNHDECCCGLSYGLELRCDATRRSHFTTTTT